MITTRSTNQPPTNKSKTPSRKITYLTSPYLTLSLPIPHPPPPSTHEHSQQLAQNLPNMQPRWRSRLSRRSHILTYDPSKRKLRGRSEGREFDSHSGQINFFFRRGEGGGWFFFFPFSFLLGRNKGGGIKVVWMGFIDLNGCCSRWMDGGV